MDDKFWDSFAANYDEHFLDSLNSDRNHVIEESILKYANPNKLACDYGCGIGKYLPTLASLFKRVDAVDFSQKLLDVAKTKHGNKQNINFIRCDLALNVPPTEKPQFAVCANLLIMTCEQIRRRILQNIYNHLDIGAYAIIIVPSTESALYSNQRLLEWSLHDRVNGEIAKEESIPANSETAANLLVGIFDVEGIRTKHYLREEIIVMLRSVGLEIVSDSKVEYNWDTEFARPPSWLSDPYPWDWLLIVQKSNKG